MNYKETIKMKNFYELIKEYDESITFCGDTYKRYKIYDYCEKNNLKFIKHSRKVKQYICKEHKCHLKFFDTIVKCCWECDCYCPYDGCYDYIEVINKQKCITIYKEKPNYNGKVYQII